MTDIIERNIPEEVLKLLLKDYTTDSNIIWGTSLYGYPETSEMDYNQVLDNNIKPRYLKSSEDQKSRTDSKAEVFTPLSIIKKMNDQVDQDFSGSDIDYINRTVIEVTCGEAPYLVNRYDASTGEEVSLQNREGLLDRKLRRVNQNCDEVSDWLFQSQKALKSTYGYEWQGDSLLLARENVLYAIDDWFYDKFHIHLTPVDLVSYAKIISHNIIQMDGIKLTIPMTDISARIMNWESGEFERFDGEEDEISLF